MNSPPPGYERAWKLFECYQDADNNLWPRTLVHGLELPNSNGRRTRILKNIYGRVLSKLPGTKGFNLFPTISTCLSYLPRFNRRMCRLYIGEVFAKSPTKDPTGHYWLSDKIIIPEFNLQQAWVLIGFDNEP
jgi:hypothetical protein